MNRLVSVNGELLKDKVVQWIRDFFEDNGKDCNAVVGISGGKDSSIVAALCVEALGKERVIGVLMPCGEQADIDMSKKLVSLHPHPQSGFFGAKSRPEELKI